MYVKELLIQTRKEFFKSIHSAVNQLYLKKKERFFPGNSILGATHCSAHRSADRNRTPGSAWGHTCVGGEAEAGLLLCPLPTWRSHKKECLVKQIHMGKLAARNDSLPQKTCKRKPKLTDMAFLVHSSRILMCIEYQCPRQGPPHSGAPSLICLALWPEKN